MKSNYYLIAIWISFFYSTTVYGEDILCPVLKQDFMKSRLPDGWFVAEGDMEKQIKTLNVPNGRPVDQRNMNKQIKTLTFTKAVLLNNSENIQAACYYKNDKNDIIRIQNYNIRSMRGQYSYTFDNINQINAHEVNCIGHISNCAFKKVAEAQQPPPAKAEADRVAAQKATADKAATDKAAADQKAAAQAAQASAIRFFLYHLAIS